MFSSFYGDIGGYQKHGVICGNLGRSGGTWGIC